MKISKGILIIFVIMSFSLSGKSDISSHKMSEYLKYIPDQGLRKAFQEYLDKVVQVNSNNSDSITDYNQKLLNKSPCLSELAVDFYSELRVLDAQIAAPEFVKRDSVNYKLRNWNLSESAGRGALAKVPAGKVWDLASEVSSGDGNLAVALINFCGHDDYMSQYPTIENASPSQRQKYLAAEGNYDLALSKLKERSSSAVELNSDPKQGLQIVCHDKSILYAPQALGKDVDISEHLKKQIANRQAPTKGASILGAKYYHVHAGMATGCLVKQESGYSFVGSLLAKNSAKIYRGIRMPPNGVEQEGAKKDAWRLWKKWYDGVSIPGFGTVYFPNPGRRPENDPNIISRHWMNPNPPSSQDFKDCLEPSWSRKRCLEALAVLDAWEIDFSWSGEQHWVGARFGEKVCTQFKKGETIESRACRVLNERKNSKNKFQRPQGVR